MRDDLCPLRNLRPFWIVALGKEDDHLFSIPKSSRRRSTACHRWPLDRSSKVNRGVGRKLTDYKAPPDPGAGMITSRPHESETNRHSPIRIFVCVDTKTDGLRCCAANHSSFLLQRLRRVIAAYGRQAVHLDVRPCNCVGLCDEGPVMLAFGGKAARQVRPPLAFDVPSAGQQPVAQFRNVTEATLESIVETLLQIITQRS